MNVVFMQFFRLNSFHSASVEPLNHVTFEILSKNSFVFFPLPDLPDPALLFLLEFRNLFKSHLFNVVAVGQCADYSPLWLIHFRIKCSISCSSSSRPRDGARNLQREFYLRYLSPFYLVFEAFHTLAR